MPFDYSSSFAGINNAISNIGKQNELAYQRQTLAKLGQQIQSGDYAGAAQAAFSAGDAGTGIGLLKLGQAEKERQAIQSGISAWSSGASPSTTGATSTSIGTPNDVENSFVGAVKNAGLTNPVGLGAVAAYGKAESGYNPGNVNRSWSDPSQSGQPGTAGGIMSWRADRLQNLQRFAASRGEQGNGSPATQALFLAQEDPALIPKLQAAKSPEEANQIMANAWRFAGYNQPGGENARRLALTQGYAQRFGGQAGPAPAVPVQFAANEAEVQRLEAQQGNPVIDAPTAPVQVAQAAPQAGSPLADVPAAGASNAQGYFIPPAGGQEVDAVANDPQVQLWRQRLNSPLAVQSPAARAIAERNLDLAMKDAERRLGTGGPLDRENKRLQNEKLRRDLEGDGARPMTPDERKAYSVPDGQAAYIKRNGDPGFGPAGTVIKNEGTLPAGYRAVRDANGNLERIEPIPGSEAATKAAEAEKKATIRQQYSETTGNAVINALNDVDRLMKSATLPTTGAMGARLAAIPGTAAHDIANALTTVGGNITIENLNQMRQASPTGGALGAVSDTEGMMLRNAWGSLQQSQTEEQFKTNLGRVRAIFERIVHGRTLTPKEREIGGPMTAERAKGLRDDAAAAIASGAPRDEVVKRLKEHYGINTDGL